MSTRILFADDQAEFLKLCLDRFLRAGDFAVDTASSSAECREKVRSKPFDVVMLDLNFGHGVGDGLALLPEIRSLLPEAAILMLTNTDDLKTMHTCTELGADDFAVKGQNGMDEVKRRISLALAKRAVAKTRPEEGKAAAARAKAAFTSKAMTAAFELAACYRRAPWLNVLITGESGTGKEVIATAMSRGDEGRPFVAVNCGAIPETMVEGTLFGHAKGAFTGAIRDQRGKFEEAHGGDIFLDEVARLPMHAQTALLRLLETKESSRLGGSGSRKLDFRVIAATNEDLDAMVKAGTFREDLLFRLAGGKIHLLPLDERREDIEPIIRRFLAERRGADISYECLRFLSSIAWPGNARELRQTIDKMLATASGPMLTIADVPPALAARLGGGRTASDTTSEIGDGRLEINFSIDVTLEDALSELTARLIDAKRRALGGDANQTELAKSLKISRSSLQRYLRELRPAVAN